MTKVKASPVARQIPFDTSSNDFQSPNVQGAIEETLLLAEGVPRAPIFFWDWNSNPIYLHLFGQVRSNELPFVISQNSKLRELSCGGRQNTTTANAIFALYKITDPSLAPSFGTLPTVTNQSLTYTESDFPYAGSTRVTINLVNNGPSLPLSFSENLISKTVTIQLATNGAGVVTTTATQLRDAFRLNTTITLIYKVTGTGGTLTTASFVTSGGTTGDAIGAVFMRAKPWGRTSGYEVDLVPGDFLVGRVFEQDIGSFSPSSMTSFISFSG
jgi:hypothetical protein